MATEQAAPKLDKVESVVAEGEDSENKSSSIGNVQPELDRDVEEGARRIKEAIKAMEYRKG